jgi:hypothetical protein
MCCPVSRSPWCTPHCYYIQSVVVPLSLLPNGLDWGWLLTDNHGRDGRYFCGFVQACITWGLSFTAVPLKCIRQAYEVLLADYCCGRPLAVRITASLAPFY